MSLITVERAKRAFAPRAWTEADNAELAQAAATASELARRFCGAPLGPGETAEIHDPNGGRDAPVRHRPARALLSAATDPAPALAIGRDRPGTVRLSTTELVLVPTIVRDKSGQHISGLSKQDFVVMQDGHAQKRPER